MWTMARRGVFLWQNRKQTYLTYLHAWQCHMHRSHFKGLKMLGNKSITVVIRRVFYILQLANRHIAFFQNCRPLSICPKNRNHFTCRTIIMKTDLWKWRETSSLWYVSSIIGHFRITFSLFLKASLGAQNEFHLHLNEISFSYERMSTKTRFEEEAKGNSEMAYCVSP